MTPEDFPSDSFRAIPLNRAPELPTGRDTKPQSNPAVCNDEQSHEAS